MEARRSALRRRSSLVAGCGADNLWEELTWEVSTEVVSSSPDDPNDCLVIPAGSVVEELLPSGWHDALVVSVFGPSVLTARRRNACHGPFGTGFLRGGLASTLLVHRSKSGHAPTFLMRQLTVERKRKQTGSRDGKNELPGFQIGARDAEFGVHPPKLAGCSTRLAPVGLGNNLEASVVQRLVSKRAELIRCRHPEAGSG